MPYQAVNAVTLPRLLSAGNLSARRFVTYKSDIGVSTPSGAGALQNIIGVTLADFVVPDGSQNSTKFAGCLIALMSSGIVEVEASTRTIGGGTLLISGTDGRAVPSGTTPGAASFPDGNLYALVGVALEGGVNSQILEVALTNTGVIQR